MIGHFVGVRLTAITESSQNQVLKSIDIQTTKRQTAVDDCLELEFNQLDIL
jgi:hypothetical protein